MATIAATPQTTTTKRTLTFQREIGPLVVDAWEAAEPSGAAPIVLVHGWGGTGSYWESTAVQLAATVPVYVPDMPGTGRSQPVTSAQDLDAQVQTLIDLLDLLGLERVQFVGHSMGSAMALLATVAVPERVERLVLTSLAFFMTQAQVRVYRTVMSVFKLTMPLRAPWMQKVPGMSHMMAKRYFHRLPQDKNLLQQGLRDFLELDGPTATACADDAPTEAIPAAGAKLTVPAMLICGRQDQNMPVGNVGYTAQTIPNCVVRWLDDCGHFPMLEHPAQYMTFLREFLEL